MGDQKNRFFVVGYQPKAGVLSAEYGDFPVGMVLNFEEVKTGIEQGIYPPGLILQHPKGRACVVIGKYGDQEFKPLIEGIEKKHGRNIVGE